MDKRTKDIHQDFKSFTIAKDRKEKKYKSFFKTKGIDLKVASKSPLQIKKVTVLAESLKKSFVNHKKPESKVIHLKNQTPKNTVKKDKNDILKTISEKELQAIKEIVKAELKEELKKELSEKQDLSKEELKEKITKNKQEIGKVKEKEQNLIKQSKSNKINEEQLTKLRVQNKALERETKELTSEYKTKNKTGLEKLGKLINKLSMFSAGVLSIPTSPMLATATLLLSTRIKGSSEYVKENKVTITKPSKMYEVSKEISLSSLDSIIGNLQDAMKEAENLENTILKEYNFIIDNKEVKAAINEVNKIKNQISAKQIEVTTQYKELEAQEQEQDYDMGNRAR